MDTDRFTLPSIRQRLEAGHKLPHPSEVQYLLDEVDRLTRHNRALDTENKRLTDLLGQREAEFIAVESEMLDVSDELLRCRQDLELVKLRAAQADATASCVHDACATAEGNL